MSLSIVADVSTRNCDSSRLKLKIRCIISRLNGTKKWQLLKICGQKADLERFVKLYGIMAWVMNFFQWRSLAQHLFRGRLMTVEPWSALNTILHRMMEVCHVWNDSKIESIGVALCIVIHCKSSFVLRESRDVVKGDRNWRENVSRFHWIRC